VREAERRSREPQVYTEVAMAAATGGFRDPIDEGAFGAVYRGELQAPAWPSGCMVAIKVLKVEASAAAVAEKAQEYVGAGGFRKELEVLGKYTHRNIVTLIGYCLSDDAAARQCLVLEWMDGGSLRGRLAAESAAPPLSTQQRFDVASDVARGLAYLHLKADPPIIHQDIKSANVLLCEINGALVAKIADFGTARYAPALLDTGVSKIETQTVIGTKPYMPPEYTMLGRVSEKTDTYAFGVVLCELLTGLPPADYEAGEMLAMRMMKPLADPKRLLKPLLDKRLSGAGWPLKRAVALGRVAAHCIEASASDRCVVADVLPDIEAVAERTAVKLAGRGEEYDPMTGELVQQKKGKKKVVKPTVAAAAAAGHGGGAGMLGSTS
jgi:serine/threonine protein kinase